MLRKGKDSTQHVVTGSATLFLGTPTDCHRGGGKRGNNNIPSPGMFGRMCLPASESLPGGTNKQGHGDILLTFWHTFWAFDQTSELRR